jgi:O-6-methylguanine DNA methyltransferase
MPDKAKCISFELPIETSEGVFLAHYSEKGLSALSFPRGKNREQAATRKIPNAAVPEFVRGWHKLTSAALTRSLSGHEPKEVPPLDLSSGTTFQQRVWAGMLRISYGETSSYAELAQAIGSPRALRAVGGACGANPIPVLVPCHRVLAAHHRLGGFSGGLDWKRRLLAIEGIRTKENSESLQGMLFAAHASRAGKAKRLSLS